MGKDRIEKLKQYIYQDRPQRLRAYVTKYKIKLPDIVLDKRRNLLHYCCKHGSNVILRYLISEGVNPYEKDRKLNCPLHLALERALKHVDRANTVYTDLVLPLIEKFPDLLDAANLEEMSCRSLLGKLVETRQSNQDDEREMRFKRDCGRHSTRDRAQSSEEHSDRFWRDKLADEANEEFGDVCGNSEDDYYGSFREKETYDEWANRISQEYWTKRKHTFQHTHTTSRPGRKDKGKEKSGKKQKTGAENFKDVREQLRKRYEERQRETEERNITKKKLDYERKFNDLLSRDRVICLRINDIPWPSGKTVEDDLKILLHDLGEKDSAKYRKYIREQQIRWHPDKFFQKFGDILDESEKDKILDRVKSISQALNKLCEKS
ncbi:hypothetical protein CHS0354_039189 [Potamilus streckersoni]|uniref:NF-kappa-B inhibitor-like protein 1 n=1 Tax=Potamilus streckersoni TaxID=2493646 RepID=A0AAE0TFG1_9BIVA|nr:hypothetical protein CHS0354_039189 [Potamilus streckersoni]